MARIGRKDQEAREAFTKAIELNPKDALAYFNRGAAYAQLGDDRVAGMDRNDRPEWAGIRIKSIDVYLWS